VLRNTFCHIPGIGPKSERMLWDQGILSWDDVLSAAPGQSFGRNRHHLRNSVQESSERLDKQDVHYFAKQLPSHQQWRLFPEFRDSVVYLDIETSGMAPPDNYITTIATYDGLSIAYYVKGYNLRQFRYDIERYAVVVTYSGRCFDIPVIESHFGIRMNHAQIDLRFVLKSLGFTGGLKGCEKKLGIDRRELNGVDGYLAVLLWHDFSTNKNFKALETLLAYNILDAVNLEMLMVMAYNLKLRDTPFLETHRLMLPSPVDNLFEADSATVKKLTDLREMHLS
jgi:uncharacterized protein YprB with RNaseH-like and TPR domain